ncbi:MAG: phenylalanine 4-monooxygenase [Vicinamibacteria bacterium]
MNSTLIESAPLVTLSAGHPGEGDSTYIARRSALSALVASVDEFGPSLPEVHYTEAETEVWRAVMDRLSNLHEWHAAATYQAGFRRLGLSASRPPVPGSLARSLREETGFGLVLTDGLLDARVFLKHLGKRRQPCTVYLRHGSRPDYTPEPDLVHEAVGHAPMLTDPDAARLNEVIGSAAALASDRQLRALLRLYWFTLEFGLVEERGGLRAYGAGLLSSFGELPHAFTDAVDRRPFSLPEVIEQDYAHDRMQDVLFVAPSLGALLAEVQPWLASPGYARLGS